MNKIFGFLICTFISSLLMAQPPKGDANAGMVFGEKTTTEGSVKSTDLSELVKEGKSLEVKVEGEVAEVCTAEGCWLKMKAGDKLVMVKMKDHKFLVPLSMNGKTIVVKGIAENKVTSVAMLKHYAEDGGKSEKEIAAITKPKQEIIIQATGIVVVN